MKLAKVITLNDKVQAIVKKAVVNGKHSFTVSFVGMLEDSSIANTTLTMEYGSERSRDNDFNLIGKKIALRLVKALPTFKELL